jgi:hypothetical protein
MARKGHQFKNYIYCLILNKSNIYNNLKEPKLQVKQPEMENVAIQDRGKSNSNIKS